MNKLFLIACLALPSWAVTRDVCASGCTYNNSQLQTALDAQGPGDVLILAAGVTYSGNFTYPHHACTAGAFVTVQSSAISYLPDSNTMVAESDLPNMPIISTPNTAPALSGAWTLNNPANCWHFVGLGFGTASTSNFTYMLIRLRPDSYDPDKAVTDADLPDDVVFDRCFIFAPHDDSIIVQNAIYANSRSFTVKNSQFSNILYTGAESHALLGVTMKGPWTIENNNFIVAGIPLMLGGLPPDYPVQPANVTVKHNYFGKYYKWWGDQLMATAGSTYNPYYADYVARGVDPCMKNNGEFKTIDTALWQYNYHELSPGFCQSQANGATLTPRNQWNYVGGSTATIAAASPTMSYTGSHVDVPNGQGVCVLFTGATNTLYCGVVISSTTSTITVDRNFGGTGSGAWTIIETVNLDWKDVTYQDNIWTDGLACVSVLGLDPSPNNDIGASVVTNLQIKNNLCTTKYVPLQVGFRLTLGPSSAMYGVTKYTDGLVVENNTVYVPPALESLYAYAWITAADSMGTTGFADGAVFRNNIAPSGEYGWFFGTPGNGGAVVNDYYRPNAVVSYNATPGTSWSCTGGRTCTNNDTGTYTPNFVNAAAGNFTVASGPYYNTGSDGNSKGVNMAQLPTVLNIAVTPTATTATLEADLGTNIASRTCVLEVSSDRDVQSKLGTYTVTNDLNPAYFIRAAASNRAHANLPTPTISSGHLTWQIGANTTVTDDHGASRSLALTSATTYYGNLQCSGNMQRFSFTTTSGAAPATGARRFGATRSFGGAR
jgi:hypothetical protein